MIRQGDLLFVPCDSIPADAVADPSGVIARGEATGHAHRLQLAKGRLLLFAAGVAYIKAQYKATVDHEEHGAVVLPPGNYQVKIQREYEPAGWRQVQD